MTVEMMTTDPSSIPDFAGQAATGDAVALGRILEEYRPRLRRIVGFRLDARVRGRFDESDVIQESYVEVMRRFPEYLRKPTQSLFVWVRFITQQKLIELHRHHLGAGAQRETRCIAVPGPASRSHFRLPGGPAARQVHLPLSGSGES